MSNNMAYTLHLRLTNANISLCLKVGVPDLMNSFMQVNTIGVALRFP
jgi:hypothetical protein